MKHNRAKILEKILKMPESFINFFPLKERKENYWHFDNFFPKSQQKKDYWHFHLPLPATYIDSKRTSQKIKKMAVEALLKSCRSLMSNKPKGFVKVVTIIELPILSNSQIIVFFTKDYYKNFFERNTKEQTWLRLPKKRSLFDEWNLDEKTKLPEVGYKEILNEDNEIYESELWCYGDVP